MYLMTNELVELLEMLTDRGGVVVEPWEAQALVEACRSAGLTTASWPVGQYYAKVVLTTED
jgi:hypothetical protein